MYFCTICTNKVYYYCYYSGGVCVCFTGLLPAFQAEHGVQDREVVQRRCVARGPGQGVLPQSGRSLHPHQDEGDGRLVAESGRVVVEKSGRVVVEKFSDLTSFFCLFFKVPLNR